MSPDYYLSQLRVYSRFVRNFNPAQQQGPSRMLKIAVGPGGPEPRFLEWTETIMKSWKGRQWAGTTWTASRCTPTRSSAGRRPTRRVGFGEKMRRNPEDPGDGRHHRQARGDHGTRTDEKSRSSSTSGARGTKLPGTPEGLSRAAEQPATASWRRWFSSSPATPIASAWPTSRRW